jgi:hypothetical protein
MRRTHLIHLLPLLSPIAAIDVGYSPYTNPLFGVSDESLLVRRQQNNCQSGYTSCSIYGATDACCPPDTVCALDQAGNVACCPINAACTGTVSGAQSGSLTGPTSTSGFVLGTSTTSTTAFVTAGLPTSGVAGGGSTVPNTFYPFVYIPTSYANADLCLSGYSQCQAQSTACFTSLAGAQGVTVSGVGFGVTVQGATGTALSLASSICSSLSGQACYNIQTDVCTNFGGAVQTDSTGGNAQGNHMPRQTPCPRMLYAAGAGAMLGAVGAFA